jgi:transposase
MIRFHRGAQAAGSRTRRRAGAGARRTVQRRVPRFRMRCLDRVSADDREAQARSVWTAQRAHGAAPRSDGAAARGARCRRHRRRGRGREGGSRRRRGHAGAGFTRERPARAPFRHICRASESLLSARPLAPAAARAGSPSSARISPRALEVAPRRWKVVQHVRKKFTCRDYDKISQAPAPFHALPRDFARPSLLAMILFEEYGQHQTLNCQSERYAGEASS